jgi:hypothetical protein
LKLFFAVLLVLAPLASAEDFQQAKLLDVQAFKAAGPSIVAPNGNNSVIIPTSRNMFTITVAIGEMAYSAQFRESRHFKPSQFVVGDPIEAKVEGDKLILKNSENKEEKAKIVRRERLAKS